MSAVVVAGDGVSSATGVDRTVAIRALNDSLRRDLVGGRVMMTQGIAALATKDRDAVIQAVRTFNAFSTDNDPYGEHDFGAVEHAGVRYFWKVDYYDRSLTSGSPDPADPTVTTRVLTIMRADEY